MKTKKVGSTGRFGTRYGSTLRKRTLRVEQELKVWHKCPSCSSSRVKRASIGIWICRFCGHKFTGGAYSPETAPGKTAMRTAKRLRTIES
ncbi:MAG: 50S ribosomal protein L37Ae [Candidatus Hodarchaeales archaeon]